MSNTSDRSTESEDGEIDRHKKYRRSAGERADTHRHHDYDNKHRKRHKDNDSPDLQFVSDENHSTPDEEYEEVEQYEDEDMLDDTNEEGLDIKPPQHKASTSSRHKNYSFDANYYRNTTEKSLSRSAKEEPFRQKDRHRDKHRNKSRYSDNRSAKSEEEVKRRRRDDETEANVNPIRSRVTDKEKDKSSERWMVLDDKNYSSNDSQNWRSKTNEQTSNRLHKQRHNKELPLNREKSRKSPKLDKNTDKVMDSSNISSAQNSKQTAKRLNATIEVQEVEMSEEEMLSEEHNTVSERSDVSSESIENETQEAEEHEKKEDLIPTEDNENEDKIPRIVVDHDVVYYSESNAIEKSVKSGEELEELGDEMSSDLPDYYPAIQGCRSVEEFQCINRIEEGTYGVVYRARDKRTNETVALKRLKMEKEKEGFPITSLREISTLLKAQHENIVTVREIVVGSNMDKIYIVMEFVEHDLKSLMETMKQPFLLGEVKTLMQQLLRAVAHLHDNWILHRDLKTSNLLLSHRGILKVGDFGLAREYGSPLKAYTPIVVTLWYRSPELLLQAKQYSYPIDIWSVGCIYGELLTMKPLFPGKSEIDQLNAIFKDLGTPNDKIWPEYSELPLVKKVAFADHPYNNLHNRLGQKLTKLGFDLLNRFLTYCPKRRITAEDALKHEFFNESPLPVDPSMFPTWPAKSEQSGNSQPRKAHSPKPPSGGKQFAKQLAGDDYEKMIESQGFHMSLPVQGKASKGGGFNLKF
ncbi:unnamed protein product [Oppiella nova]|uniref:cyclin-dependent kinase n=1 Tax=Oppiella nova TaxID=334625 RepID=A0A7R9LJ11_9ACAR|nr:unnamed protein product [Oppiella nova]CAG2163465.1 unnamed protein product [Oppiella nova]